MAHNTQIRKHIVYYFLFSLLLSGIIIGIIAAYSLSPQMSINKIQIKGITENTELVIGDGKDIIISGGEAGVLMFWRQMLISHLSAFFEGTPLHDLIFVIASFLDTLLKYFCVAHFQSTKQRKGSIVPQQVLAHVRENPGCSQKQLITELMVSRGSICYHLHKLRSTGKLMQISRNGSTLYYLTGTETGEQFEQTLFQLLTRKKSGKFLQVLYEHPRTNRTELAEFLNLSPETLRWYLRRYAEEDIVSVEIVGTEYRYSFTPKAELVYKYLRHTKDGNHDITNREL